MTRLIEQQILAQASGFQEQLGMLQILQSSVGCANSCSMCSQGASPGITRITQNSLSQILSGLKLLRGSSIAQGVPLLGGDRSHKPGIIFPYLDTDVGSDPNLAFIIQSLGRDFRCKTRISTVGFSRHNQKLQQMHTIIANNLANYVEGFRISLTPYTENFFSVDYPLDIANLLNVYLPIIETQGVGRDIFACEMRFPPYIQLGDVQIGSFLGRLFIRSGDYFFITDDQNNDFLDNKIVGVENRVVQFKQPGTKGKIYIGDRLSEMPIEEVLSRTPYMDGEIYRIENVDGVVFAINPLFNENGEFHAIHFLPKTLTREKSGIIDSSRPFLNAMIAYKEGKHISGKGKLQNGDIDDFLFFLEKYMGCHAPTLSVLDFWVKNILPVIRVAAQIIKGSDIDEDRFFDPKFLVDTGHIVNQGRAKHIFQGLVSEADEPLTVNEMKGYAGENSMGSSRGIIYRLAPIPVNSAGIRNIVKSKNGLILSGLSHKGLQPVPEMTHYIPTDIETTYTPKKEVVSHFGIPGLFKNK